MLARLIVVLAIAFFLIPQVTEAASPTSPPRWVEKAKGYPTLVQRVGRKDKVLFHCNQPGGRFGSRELAQWVGGDANGWYRVSEGKKFSWVYDHRRVDPNGFAYLKPAMGRLQVSGSHEITATYSVAVPTVMATFRCISRLDKSIKLKSTPSVHIWMYRDAPARIAAQVGGSGWRRINPTGFKYEGAQAALTVPQGAVLDHPGGRATAGHVVTTSVATLWYNPLS